MTDVLDIVPPAPKYKVIKVVSEKEEVGFKQTLTLVKLSRPHVFRYVGKQQYADTDYVLIGAVAIDREDGNGAYHYEETAITASDEEGTTYEAFLYLGPRCLTVEESMWVLGEI